MTAFTRFWAKAKGKAKAKAKAKGKAKGKKGKKGKKGGSKKNVQVLRICGSDCTDGDEIYVDSIMKEMRGTKTKLMIFVSYQPVSLSHSSRSFAAARVTLGMFDWYKKLASDNGVAGQVYVVMSPEKGDVRSPMLQKHISAPGWTFAVGANEAVPSNEPLTEKENAAIAASTWSKDKIKTFVSSFDVIDCWALGCSEFANYLPESVKGRVSVAAIQGGAMFDKHPLECAGLHCHSKKGQDLGSIKPPGAGNNIYMCPDAFEKLWEFQKETHSKCRPLYMGTEAAGWFSQVQLYNIWSALVADGHKDIAKYVKAMVDKGSGGKIYDIELRIHQVPDQFPRTYELVSTYNPLNREQRLLYLIKQPENVTVAATKETDPLKIAKFIEVWGKYFKVHQDIEQVPVPVVALVVDPPKPTGN
jgi:hypothetical protein